MTRLVIPAATTAALGACLLPLRREPTQELPPLVVTALRGSVLPEHFSGNATVIDEAAVVKAGVRSLGELLEIQGGLRVSSTAGDTARGTIHLRGFGDNSASRVLVMVDGRPLNRPDMSGIALQESRWPAWPAWKFCAAAKPPALAIRRSAASSISSPNSLTISWARVPATSSSIRH